MEGLLAVAEVAGVGLPLALVLLVPMEAGVPIPIPDDVVMLVVGERVAAGALPWWVGALALELVAVAGTVLLFAGTRLAGRALVQRLGRASGCGRIASRARRPRSSDGDGSRSRWGARCRGCAP